MKDQVDALTASGVPATFLNSSLKAEESRARLRGHIRHTPLVASPSLSRHTGGAVHLKLDCLQITGSFKLRGALNALLQLDPEARTRGVIGVSTGNYGRALAHAAHSMGVRAVICISLEMATFDCPLATHLSTSRCRGVSRSS